MSRAMTVSLAAALLALLPGPAAASEYARHWTRFGDAPTAYWLLAAAVSVLVLAAVYYLDRSAGAIRGEASKKGYVLLAALMVLVVAGTFVVYLYAGTGVGIQASEDAWDWEPGETLRDPGGSDLTGEPFGGYQVAISQGCFQGSCHTLFVRPQDTAPGHASLYYREPSEAGDYANFPMPPWGTQRNGPDLSHAGSVKPSMQLQKQHLRDPRSTAPNSIMPSYDHLSEEQLNDLAAFVVSLGQDPGELKAGGPAGTPTGLGEAARRGRETAAQQGCTGCHTTTGETSTGPTWKGLYNSTEQLTDGSTVRVDEQYLRESIVDPDAKVVQGFQPVMPSYDHLSDEDVDDMVEYIKTLE